MKRREILKAFTALGAVQVTGYAAAQGEAVPTGSDAQGPYYPVEPIPHDRSLITAPAFVGEELEFNGRVLDTRGKPLKEVLVEIWQCDGNSIYDHPKAPNRQKRDPAFRGFGAQLTDQSGAYHFRTLVPVPYPGRPPHIHAKLWQHKKAVLITQIYLEGNNGDQSRKISPHKVSAEGSSTIQYQATFDFVLTV